MYVQPKNPSQQYTSTNELSFFVSHSSEDSLEAEALTAALEAQGKRCWIAPRDIRPGNSYAAEITHGVETAPVFLVLVSNHSNQSNSVLSEVELARRFNRIMVPVFVEDVSLSKALLYYLSAAQWVSYYKDPETALRQILAARR
jgi:hypothetical protein